MVGLVGIKKLAILNHVMGISNYFYMKKVRPFSNPFGRPSALSGRLKLQSEVTWSNCTNFSNLTIVRPTKSTILNKKALLKMQRFKNLRKLNF